MPEDRRSRIRPGHVAMTLFGVIVPIFLVDIWHMAIRDVIVARAWIFLVKVVILGAWYETMRDRLMARFATLPPFVQALPNARWRHAIIDSLWFAAFQSTLYGTVMIAEQWIHPERDQVNSLIAWLVNAFGCMVTGPLIGLVIDWLKSLWSRARGLGPKKAVRMAFSMLLRR